MEITTEITKDEYEQFIKNDYLKKDWVKHIAILAIIAAGLTVLGCFTKGDWHLLYSFFVMWLLILLLFFFALPYAINYSKIQRLLRGISGQDDKWVFNITEKGIQADNGAGSKFFQWGAVDKIYPAGNYMVIKLANDSVFLLPVNSLENEDAAEYLSHINVYMKKTVNNNKEKPKVGGIYFVGILCLIPFFGAIAGLVLLILGIVHYKDKLLIAIGAGGIIITIGFYAWLIHTAMNADVFKTGFATIAQSQVNDLVKSVEFYKLQNGAYPDSLQQVITKDSFTSIYDPLQTSLAGDNKAGAYIYNKIDSNHYMLFSRGIDGMLYTKDDIYPTLTNPDTSKLGFVRK
ncbi:MAG TPA: YcxB family protein [Mucilaginibacter sp.]|nr:YcxB family protein [Mucilaginibacter sp.]